MKVIEAVELMSKRHLQWVLDSYTRDVPPMEEEDMRKHIVDATDVLAKTTRVQTKLSLFDFPHSTRTLIHFYLESLINAPDYQLLETELFERVQAREQKLLDEAGSENALQYADKRSVEVFETVLEVALEDDEISRDEFALLERLRTKLKLSRKQQWLLEAKLNKFPNANNLLHTHNEVSEATKILEKMGIVFYCKTTEGYAAVLPEEIAPAVKEVLEIELSDTARNLLWGAFSGQMLKDVLREFSLPVSGTKAEMVERLEESETQPQEALHTLKNDQLYDLCSSLHNVAVSGSKDEKVERIIHYFDTLVTHDTNEEDSTVEKAFAFYEQLAHREYGSLRSNSIISKDNEIEHLFEQATTFIFDEIFGLEMLPMTASKHPDGCTMFANDKSLFLWDCKSQEKSYTFPSSHSDQFKRYIREFRSYLEVPPSDRVNTFLVIVPQIEDAEDVGLRCRAAKATSGQDTDIAVVAAEDLKWLAELWRDSKNKSPFSLHVFNETGVLNRRKLEQAAKLFLNL